MAPVATRSLNYTNAVTSNSADLIRNAGGSLTSKPIADVMDAIKKLAVREKNVMVARVTLHNMGLDRDNPFAAILLALRDRLVFLSSHLNANVASTAFHTLTISYVTSSSKTFLTTTSSWNSLVTPTNPSF